MFEEKVVERIQKYSISKQNRADGKKYGNVNSDDPYSIPYWLSVGGLLNTIVNERVLDGPAQIHLGIQFLIDDCHIFRSRLPVEADINDPVFVT